MIDPSEYIRPHLQTMDPYVPVLPFEVRAQQMGCPPESIVKLDANENPYGPHPEVRHALAELAYPHIYPDPESRALREALSEFTGVPIENLLAGAGADELIDLTMRLTLDPGVAILNCPPTFGMYLFDGSVNGANVIAVDRRTDFSLDLEAIETAVERHRPKLLFIANPNNPDGGLIETGVLERLLNLPLILVLDEAYIEFAGPNRSCISMVPQTNNLVVLRTFSKWAGLAGLRVGYGAFPSFMMHGLWKIKQPYNVSVSASTAALISLRHRDELMETVERITEERQQLFRGLQSISYLIPYPSQTNFILCRLLDRNARQIRDELAHRGILIRHYDEPNLMNTLRISVGKPEHTQAILTALREWE